MPNISLEVDNIKPEIQVRNLNISYHGRQNVVALHDINVDIPKNRLTAIVGPSGCGKTTLLKALNRLHDIKEGVRVDGHIVIGGEDIYHSKLPVFELRRRVGLIAQKPFPLPASIYDNVAYGPRIHRRLKGSALDQVVKRCLQQAHLWDEVETRLDAPAAGLSVGQQQRLCIARALAVEPDVILCDEPTSALDPLSSQKVEGLLLALKEKYTIVMVTHILRQARRLADYLIFLYMGQVIEVGEAGQMFGSPRHEITQEYMRGMMAGA